jgi:hypothetical protein
MPSNLRRSISHIGQKTIRATVLSYVGNRIDVLLGGQQVHRNIELIGGPIKVGQEVLIDYSSGRPIAHAIGMNTTASSTSNTSARFARIDPDIPEGLPGLPPVFPEHEHYFVNLIDVPPAPDDSYFYFDGMNYGWTESENLPGSSGSSGSAAGPQGNTIVVYFNNGDAYDEYPADAENFEVVCGLGHLEANHIGRIEIPSNADLGSGEFTLDPADYVFHPGSTIAAGFRLLPGARVFNLNQRRVAEDFVGQDNNEELIGIYNPTTNGTAYLIHCNISCYHNGHGDATGVIGQIGEGKTICVDCNFDMYAAHGNTYAVRHEGDSGSFTYVESDGLPDQSPQYAGGSGSGSGFSGDNTPPDPPGTAWGGVGFLYRIVLDCSLPPGHLDFGTAFNCSGEMTGCHVYLRDPSATPFSQTPILSESTTGLFDGEEGSIIGSSFGNPVSAGTYYISFALSGNGIWSGSGTFSTIWWRGTNQDRVLFTLDGYTSETYLYNCQSNARLFCAAGQGYIYIDNVQITDPNNVLTREELYWGATPLLTERASWDTLNFPEEHANDLADEEYTVHLPPAGQDGYVLTSNGTSWSAQPAESGAVTIYGQAIRSFEGALETSQGTLRLMNELGRNVTITRVSLSIDTAPTGQSIIVDVHQNGTTIFTNQSHRPEIAASGNYGYTTTIDVNTWTSGNYLTIDIDQVGSGTPGSDMMVHIAYSWEA